MQWISRIFDKSGVFGTMISAMGCASCFPALGSVAAALGMGFLAQYESVFINTLLPIFAAIALVANLIAFFFHKVWYRALFGIAGPTMVLLTLYPLWQYSWSTYLLYIGLALMLIVAVWDILSPAQPQCANRKVS